MRGTFKGRLNLSTKASEALTFMVQQLKEENPHVQINPSKLCSWIMENYVRDHFLKESSRIAQEHFNPKRYLLDQLKEAQTGEDIKSLFQIALNKMDSGPLSPGTRKKAIKPKVITKKEEPTSPNPLPSSNQPS